MKIAIQIELGSDLMKTGPHVAEALADLSETVATKVDFHLRERGKILDSDGNQVGTWKVSR